MKTAVEWLVSELVKNKFIQEEGAFTQPLIIKAKEMEKEQKGYSEKDIKNAIDMAQDWKSIVRSRGNERIEFKYTHQEIINKIKNL